MFASALLAALAIVPSALANVYITEPIATTSWPAGQQQTITWQDSGDYPSLTQFGTASVGIFVGNALVQTQVQQIVASVNVSSTTSIVFTPDPTIGPESNEYFIRFQSLSLLQNGTNYPEEAFSAKFALSGMSGQFDAAESSEISGQSTAPIGPTTAASASSTAVAVTSSTPSATSSKASSASSGSHSASATATSSKSNGASIVGVSPVSGAAGLAVAVFAAMFF
ncbi:hypothetical protein BKA93DRAFT_771683 [Sparassis latifolia]|uniref:Yeast cell wall synthesis Kre9/Knh1-like N-terminal domain-containing protein n=1 Tax=Sparassis crispa TaxID=139825 RepID=A0A401GN30_9APHY|nr:hypothetical protein SCP_0506350 [Sparassis crispa]GBE83580.1 hypothetical protein SCP_0506350 [Sparassis crispa]